MVGSNLSITLKAGSELWGCDVNGFLSGFYSEQHLKYQNVNVNHKAYGYLNMQNDVEQAWMTDFNREKDGVIRKETPVAGSPALNSDVYNIQGQGVGGMFRPFRSDVGTVYDSKALSYSVGGAGGFDFGAGSLAKLGGDGSFNGSVSLSGGLWGGNQNSIKFRAKSNVSNQEDYEPYYYKVNGEYTSEPIEYYGIWGNDDAVRINITGIDSYSPDLVRYDVKSGTVLQTVKGSLANNYRHAVNTQHGFQSSRKPRNSSVQSFTNDELSKIDAVSNECLSEHLAFFYAAINADAFSCQTKPIDDLQKISRGNYKNQMGSYVTLDPNGTRYIYGLPVYNLKNVEDTRSVFPEYSDNTPITSGENSVVDGKFQYPSSTSPTSGIDDPNHISNEFIAHKEMPPYITSNLLTAVLGADYIDVDNNGPSENDFGYWVKFNYVKTSDASNPYKWRAPYIKGNFMQGTRALHGDDKAGYMYGEKEVYYLASAETKTHIAIFEISKRHDAKGVINEIQNSVSFIGAQSSYKLDAIKLYTKAEYYNFSTSGVKSINSTAKPISVVHLDYTYDLCKGVLNNDGAGEGNAGGKLTLKKLYFTYERSSRGALTPYIFDYKETDADYNPDYNNMNQDRWGNYKNYGSSPTTEDYMLNYTPQFSGSTTTPFQISDEKRKKNAAAWCLQSIKTPTGSDINIEYEPDDYGYVQHRTADQMFKIEGFGTLSSNQLYSNASGAWTNSNDNRSVFFKLKTPTNSIVELNKYIEDLKTPTGKKQIYFKTLINMKSDQFSDLQEYVSGYLDYESIEWGDAPSGGGLHQYGKIVLSKAKIGEKEVDFAHPISLAAWQFLHINMPELATCPGAPAEGSANPERAVKQLASIGKEIQNMFSGFNRNCKKNRWAQYADINHSIIRLNCPDKKKIGGDLRVKSIIIKDNSNYDSDDGEKEYGVVYDYTTIENGVQISSGVAAYEPIMGGDEISLRYAKDYPERIPLKTNNNLFFEYPVNESYYPGASVGYSRVTIKSLATYRQLEYLSGNAAYSKYQNILGTGETVQEYYTAKDFPVIADITEFLKINNRGVVPLPFLCQISFDSLT